MSNVLSHLNEPSIGHVIHVHRKGARPDFAELDVFLGQNILLL